MAGVEDQQGLGQLGAVGIQLSRHLEPEPSQGRGHVRGIVVRVGQPAERRTLAFAVTADIP